MMNNIVNLIFKFKKFLLFSILLFTTIMFVFSLNLEVEASAETLLLKNDKDLLLFNKSLKTFGNNNSLIVTYTVKDNILKDIHLNKIKDLSKELVKNKLVKNITSILNVPLLESPLLSMSDLSSDIPNLSNIQEKNKKLIEKEFLNSPLYKKNLVSKDLKTTGILLNLNNKINKIETHNSIKEIKNIIEKFNRDKNIELHLGGVEMIADDMENFVKNDIKIFGIIILIFLFIILFVLLKNIKWVFLSLIIAIISLIVTVGFISLFGWKITIVSSNFIPLLLIMNISLTMHLIVKYKEIYKKNNNLSQFDITSQTLTLMIKPTFFVVLTTVAGFISLMLSSILPIMNFGIMMSMGIFISLIFTFILFPLILSFFKLIKDDSNHNLFTEKISTIPLKFKKSILFFTFIIIVFTFFGIKSLKVENSFIDYFKESTEIYKGMKIIDTKLGGTTPFDIILTFNDKLDTNIVMLNSEEEFEDDFEDEFEDTEEDVSKYWLNEYKMERITKIHDYLDNLNETGKVTSIATAGKLLKKLNNGEEVSTLTLTILNEKLPEDLKKSLVSPYLNISEQKARINVRIIDTYKDLNREKLILKINKDIKELLKEDDIQFFSTNLLVIYNNLLQSLFDSQIKTIGIVIIILFMMFLILFKSLSISVIAILSNLIPVGVIFGVMGNFNIPLDMMTITIASISLGVAIDDSIHYIYRFKEERKKYDYNIAIIESHKSIGTSMFYTSVIIIVGFSMLVLSNFIPTIYFGLLTMLSMFMAIISNLILLPVLLSFKEKLN